MVEGQERAFAVDQANRPGSIDSSRKVETEGIVVSGRGVDAGGRRPFEAIGGKRPAAASP
jgi:hypothetical protein